LLYYISHHPISYFPSILFAYFIPLGEDFYGAYDAQNFAIENSKALGVTPVPSLNLVYTQEEVQKSFFSLPFFFSMKFFFYYLKIFFINDYYGKIALISPPPSHKTSHTTPHCTQDFVTADYAKEKGLTMKNLSGTKFRQMLRAGDDIPTW
jgi:sulfate adenylyltransferase